MKNIVMHCLTAWLVARAVFCDKYIDMVMICHLYNSGYNEGEFRVFHFQWSGSINVTDGTLMYSDWSSAFLRHSGFYVDQIGIISISSYHWISHWLQHFAIKSISCHCESLQDWFLNAPGKCASTHNREVFVFSTIHLNTVLQTWNVFLSNKWYFRIQFTSSAKIN